MYLNKQRETLVGVTASRFAMKTRLCPALSGLLLISLVVGCKPSTTPTAEEARRELEEARLAYEQQAAEMQQRGEELQRQLTDLQRAVQEKENAELQAQLKAIQAENTRLMAEAEAAKRKSDQLRDELASIPAATPYVPTAPAPQATQPWADPQADYSLFYDSLSSHGRWLDVTGYGYVFRPSFAERSSWRPYLDGRWVWTDQGWAWDSNEPFGWACYHYGRWVRLSRHGWVWIPGREWAPAWVSWRYGSDHVGWAPLPPSAGYGRIGHDCDARYDISPASYIFISASQFGRSSYVNASLTVSTIASLFQQTVNVTSIVQAGQNHIYIHQGGPSLDWVEKRCGSRVIRAPVQLARTLERPVEFHQNRQRPAFLAAPMPSGRADRPTHLPRIAERVQAPVIMDGWKEVPDARRGELRQAIECQSKQPQPRSLPTIPPNPAVSEMPVVPKTQNPASERTPDIRPPMPEPPGIRTPGRGISPPTAQPPTSRDAASQAELARREMEKRLQEARAEREQQMKSQQLQREREAEIMKQRLAQEQMARAEAEKNAAEMRGRETEKLRLRQQMEQDHREKNSPRMRNKPDVPEQAAKSEKEALARLQEQAAMRDREAAMAATQQAQEELARRAEQAKQQRDSQEAAMKAAQEEQLRQQKEAAIMQAREMEAEKQRQAALEAQKEAVMKAQQEMAERQRQAELQKQQEAAMRAAQEEAQRQQREAAMQAQKEAMEQAQREAAERTRQEAMRRAQEEAEKQREMLRQQQEEARRQAEEAARRAAEEAARRQAEEAARRAAEEAERQRNQPPPSQS